MDVRELEGCCGVIVFFDLQNSSGDREDFEYSCGEYPQAILVTLIPSQKKYWARTLRKNGFRVVKNFKSVNTGNKITLYYRKGNHHLKP